MRRPVLIGLAGQKGAGKNTAADGLPDALKTSFAAPVKQMLSVGLNLTEEQLNGRDKHQPISWLGNGKSITPRYLMQSLGTEWGRIMVDPAIWVKLAEQSIDDLTERHMEEWFCPPPILVTDVRFESEAEMIRARGGVIVHVLRGRKPVTGWRERLWRMWDRLTDHASEVRLPVLPEDKIILNTGTIEDLQRQLRGVVENLEKNS